MEGFERRDKEFALEASEGIQREASYSLRNSREKQFGQQSP